LLSVYTGGKYTISLKKDETLLTTVIREDLRLCLDTQKPLQWNQVPESKASAAQRVFKEIVTHFETEETTDQLMAFNRGSVIWNQTKVFAT